MGLLCLLLIILVMKKLWDESSTLYKKVEEEESKKRVEKEGCPPVRGTHHDWSYNHQDKLQCTKCNFIAGTHTTSHGEYDG